MQMYKYTMLKDYKNKYDFCFVKDNASVSAMIESNEKYKLSPSVDKKF